MAKTRPPKEMALEAAAPVAWAGAVPEEAGALVVGVAEELEAPTAPVLLATVPLPGTMGVIRVGTGAAGVAVGVGTTGDLLVARSISDGSAKTYQQQLS
jgi:hypothetical protein